MPALYRLVDIHDMSLDKFYQQIVKHGLHQCARGGQGGAAARLVTKKSEILPNNAAASFISDDCSRYDD